MRGGRHLSHVMAMLVPEAWEETRDLDPEVRGFYEYHSALMEPWDGPAGVIFTDGVRVGAVLDRNGLRPLRYALCEDGLVVCASEMGAVDVSGHGTVDRGRLGPGHMLVVSPSFGAVRNTAVKEHLAAEAPYAQWAADGFVHVPPGEPVAEPPADLLVRQAANGFTKEELAMVLKPMATDAYEPTFAMGDDSPLPPMAGRARPVAHYLRQRFAQVTNPPIDPLRERLVMSLRTLLGPRTPLLLEQADATRLLTLESFFLYPVRGRLAARSRRQPVPGGPHRRQLPRRRRARRPAGRGRGGGRHRRRARRRGRRHPRDPPRRAHRRAGPDPVAARARRGAPAARRQPAPVRHQPRRALRRRPRHPLGRRPARVRRRRRVPPPRPADRGLGGRRGRHRRPRQLRRPGAAAGRARGRRAEDPVEDGRLHHRLLPGRPALRGARPRRRGRRPLLHRHLQRRRRRWAGPRSARTPSRTTPRPSPSSPTPSPTSSRPATTGCARAASTTPTPRRSPRRSTSSPSCSTRRRCPSATPRPSTRPPPTCCSAPSRPRTTTSTAPS